ncbi:MAG: hypothetical protein ACTHU0_19270 [Kofleriaceae bacterium]
MAQLSLGDLGGIVLSPDALDEQRGAWCSPPEYTEAASSEWHFDLDPFTNPRSTLRAAYACMLERGGDGFGLDQRHIPGSFCIAPGVIGSCERPCCGSEVTARVIRMVADATWRVWIQPPYDIVAEALAHYGHTRFVALLRLDTSTAWFERLYTELCEVIMVPRRDRLEFVPPPGVKASSNPFPHGLYYRHAEDAPAAISAMCLPWPTPNYPWGEDPLELATARAGGQ